MQNGIQSDIPPRLNSAINSQLTRSDNDNKNPVKIEKIFNQAIKLTSLPAEIKQRIAFKLNVASYENLRLTCKDMSNNLPSINDISMSLKNNCSGEVKRQYEALAFEKNAIAILSDNKNEELIQSLVNLSADKHSIFKGVTVITTTHYLGTNYSSYAPPIDGTEESMIYLAESDIYCKVFIKFTDEVTKVTNDEEIVYPIVSLIQPLYTEGSKSSYLLFFDDKITPQILDTTFGTLNKLFDTENIKDKLLIAVCATRLKTYWQKNPPENINKNDIVTCTSKYPSLFSTEKIIAEQLEKNEWFFTPPQHNYSSYS